jgi:hypothetical protein
MIAQSGGWLLDSRPGCRTGQPIRYKVENAQRWMSWKRWKLIHNKPVTIDGRVRYHRKQWRIYVNSIGPLAPIRCGHCPNCADAHGDHVEITGIARPLKNVSGDVGNIWVENACPFGSGAVCDIYSLDPRPIRAKWLAVPYGSLVKVSGRWYGSFRPSLYLLRIQILQ